MSTITLPNIRVGSDLQVRVRLKDGGVAIDWSTLQNIKACIYSDAQRALAGRCAFSIDEEDSTLLVCTYAANKPQYLGVNRIVISAKYMGETKTYDKPAFSFVRWTADQEGEEITIDDPDVDVEIDVEDISSSILQEAVDAAFTAADRANDAAAAAEHMVDIHTGPEGKSAYEVAVEEGYTGTEEEWLASLKGDTGETPDISIGTVTTVAPGTPASASMTGTPEEPVLNLSIPQGVVGATPNFTVGTVTTGEPGSSVIVTITGTPEAPVLNLTIPQGMQGNTGSSVEFPYELVNNLTTDDATKGLSAAQGKVLDGKVSQLEAELTETERITKSVYIETTATWQAAFFPEKIPAGTVITGISGFDVGFYFCNSAGTYFLPLIHVNSTTFPITLEQDAYGITSNPAQAGTIYYETIKTINRIDRLEDEVSDLQDEVSEISELIDGHTPNTITESVSATQSGSYNQYLFSAIMPSGSIIKSVNTNGVVCYLLREDDTYNPTLIANLTLPYTTGENYKGILANGVGTIVITYDDGVAADGFDERLTAVEAEAGQIDEIDGVVNGEQAASPLSVNTLASYTEVLFDTPIQQGAIISAFTKSDSSLFFYLTDEDGNYDVNINSNTLKTALPYTTTKKYRGIKATAVGTVAFDFWGELGVASARKCVIIRKTDTELQLLDKMRFAFFVGDVDVFFEKAEYVLKNIYTYMRDVLGWTWTMGLPIGNGCRYFFNNSTLISQAPDNYTDDRNILDNRTSATDFEIHDVVLKMDGTGTYCIHDETSGNATPYSHIYEKVTCYQGNATRCVGIGTGFDSSLVFRDCNFFTTSNDACGIHGPSSNPESHPVKLSFEEDACFVSDGASPFALGSAYFDAGRDSIVVRLSNSRFTRAIDQTTLDLIGTFMSWGNNL